jgi:putative ABC transport system substrate-binding protein
VIVASLVLFALQAWGQQPFHRVGVLAVTEGPDEPRAWLEGLREFGYVVGRNIQVEYRYSQARTERIPALVAELVAFGPEVIVAATSPNAVAVHAAAPTIPLIFVQVGDPVAVGLVENLAHPGGNVTGFSSVVPEGFVGKQLQLLKEIVPQASRIAVLINPTNPLHPRDQGRLAEFGPQLGVELVVVEASKPDQLEPAFETARARCRGDPRLRRSPRFHSLGEGRSARRSLSIAGDVFESAECTGWRTDVVWTELRRPLA